MYSYADRMRAVKLYIKYDLSVAATLRKLGYPSKNALKQWYAEYMENGDLHNHSAKKSKYSSSQKEAAVAYYVEHGHSISRTIKAIGYPCRDVLRAWIYEVYPELRKVYSKHSSVVEYTPEQKKEIVVELCTSDSTAIAIAKHHRISRNSLYKWKKGLLSGEASSAMRKDSNAPLPDDRDALLAELEALKKEIYHRQMEIDILEKTAEILKKGQGISPRELANAEKARVIDALRDTYSLNELLKKLGIPKSSYFYQRAAQAEPDKHLFLRTKVKEIFIDNHARYGYRRIYAVLNSQGITVSEKVVRRIMNEEQLHVPLKKKRAYRSYLGEITPAVDNIIARDFHADAPNKKWLTDLTEFHIPAGKIYLSPVIDCFDGLVVSWTIGTSPNAELVNTMLDCAICGLPEGQHPIIHSDRGSHYRWPGWISRMEKAGLTRSMSQKGCSPDNSACEGFFGRLKNEMFYNRSWQDVSIEEFILSLDEYIQWYNEKRIKISLGALSPLEYRRNLGLVA